MKPDWKDAPEWATCLAMDADGSWSWYEHAPAWSDAMGHWYETEGMSEIVYEPYDDDAFKSLEYRP